MLLFFMNKISASAKELRILINDAYDILNGGTEKGGVSIFQNNKNLIKEHFERDGINTEIKLILIDSLYSTNANKSIGATKDIASAIDEYLECNPKLDFDKFAEDLKKDSDTGLYNLFKKPYGKKDAQAISLISKFFYFYTGFQFPIYDSYLRDMLHQFLSNNNSKKSKQSLKEINTYFPSIRKFYRAVGLSNDKDKYDKIDAFGWLLGKIKTNKNVFYYIENTSDPEEKNIKKLNKLFCDLNNHGFLTVTEKNKYEDNRNNYYKDQKLK